MELYIEQDEYNINVETGAGVRILVHNQTTMPFPEDIGANVAPGRETFIGLSRVRFTLITATCRLIFSFLFHIVISKNTHAR